MSSLNFVLSLVEHGKSFITSGSGGDMNCFHGSKRPKPYILRDLKNAPFYILCLFHMIDLRMFYLSFLSSCKMDHDLPWFRFAHAVHSDVILT